MILIRLKWTQLRLFQGVNPAIFFLFLRNNSYFFLNVGATVTTSFGADDFKKMEKKLQLLIDEQQQQKSQKTDSGIVAFKFVKLCHSLDLIFWV